MSNGFFKYSNQSSERCDGCRDCQIVYANGGWSFYGCYYEPYHGKWIAEIQNCPKGKKEEGK